MNSPMLSIVSYALNAAWQIPLLAAAGWVAARVLRRWGAHAQHRVWVATLLLSVLTPAFVNGHAILRPFVTAGLSVPQGASLTAIGVSDGGTLWRGTAFVLPPRLIWLLLALYIGSLLYFAARLLWLLAGARRLVRGSRLQSWTPATAALWQQARQAFAAADAVVLISDNVHGVMTIGVRRPAILLSAGLIAQSNEEDLLSALGHELAHIERRDYAKNLFYEIAGILVAFHPIAWMVKAQIVETREMVCDGMVVERLVDTKPYRQALLRLAQRMISAQPMTVHAVGIFDGNILEKRIMMMRMKGTVPGSLARAGLAGCVTVLLATTVVAVSALARPVDTPDQVEDAGNVYKIGGDVSAPAVKHTVEAEFPKSANLPKGQSAICLIGLIVDRDGMPQKVHVTRSAGKDFDTNAMQAVQQYRFNPALRHGHPVAVWITIEVNFKKY
jgi:TonB family protein